ncbi:substrate-binding domain-containing protein [Nocardioides sp. CER19]|uniref:substrate-binding domain-containing protein n=1 Tax=Nocardioides sp. CER19 TaxID=3038538 RepID=UPI00244B6AD5|nr:substrate-binding domain-containing protein [Nocardioides sp. CER19]MDH2414844.1 hypothetical protein [Nocardioides sp. CER19]
MSVRKIRATVGAVAAASALTLSVVGPALADPAGTPNAAGSATSDYVGVGSDTTQYVMQALSDAYNATASGPKLYSWDACVTTPANSATTFPCDAGNAAAPKSFTPRAGAAAEFRHTVAGSGNGRKALYGATSAQSDQYTFARSSGALDPSSADVAQQGLVAYPYALDTIVMVTAPGGNAPAQLTAAQVLGIYAGTITDWAQVGGKPGTIKPLIPFTGGTHDDFVKRLTNLNGGTALANGGNGVAINKVGSDNVQEHDPSFIYNDPNAIAPFSFGRAGFANKTSKKVSILNGWSFNRAMYNVLRSKQTDKTVPAEWLDSSAQMQALFGPTGFICSSAATSIIAQQGFWQLDSSANGGACGVKTNATAASLKAKGKGADTTTAATVTSGPANRTHPVAVSVVSAAGTPAGKVVVNVGSYVSAPVALDGTGKATVTLPATLRAGANQPVAVSFIPTDATKFSTSGADAKITVSAATPPPVVKKPAGKLKETFPSAVKKGKKATGQIKIVTPAKFTGTVKIYDGARLIKTVKVTKGVSKKVTLPKLKKGRHALKAVWAGNATYGVTTLKFAIKQK